MILSPLDRDCENWFRNFHKPFHDHLYALVHPPAGELMQKMFAPESLL